MTSHCSPATEAPGPSHHTVTFKSGHYPTARCARVSYLTHDGKRSPAADFELYDRLFSNGHVSPLEHAARPMKRQELEEHQFYEFTVKNRDGTLGVLRMRDGGKFEASLAAAGEHRRCDIVSRRVSYFCGNFNGWVQHRKETPGEAVFGSAPT